MNILKDAVSVKLDTNLKLWEGLFHPPRSLCKEEVLSSRFVVFSRNYEVTEGGKQRREETMLRRKSLSRTIFSSRRIGTFNCNIKEEAAFVYLDGYQQRAGVHQYLCNDNNNNLRGQPFINSSSSFSRLRWRRDFHSSSSRAADISFLTKPRNRFHITSEDILDPANYEKVRQDVLAFRRELKALRRIEVCD